MVYSNAPIPFSRGIKPRVFLDTIAPDPIEPFPLDSNKTLVFDALRHQISGGANMEDILESAASAAQELTHASGAAVAMGVDDTVLCVGRSGETAPPIGAQVSVNTGISGECIRSGKYIVCDDTQLDPRVDAEVCLSLGLRSLAAVPLRAPKDTIGLLEVFSNYPSNFSHEHIEILRGLGDLVELAYSRISSKAVVEEPLAAAEIELQVTALEESLSEPRAIKWLRESQIFSGGRKFPYWAIPVVLIVAMLGFRGWLTWREPATVAVAPVVAASQEITISSDAEAKPTPSRSAKRVIEKTQALDAKTSSDAPEVVVRKFDKPETLEPAMKDANDPPELPVLASNTAVLTDLVGREAAMPKAAMMVSRGVVRGSITHKVPPVYPPDALADGVTGTVLLKATINEKGNVDEVSPVSGPRVLARAAMDAVKKWQYQPSLLNGTPVQVETEITVNFKKPN